MALLTILLTACISWDAPPSERPDLRLDRVQTRQIVSYHFVDGCAVCHGTHGMSMGSNLYTISDTITTPNSGDQDVVFTDLSGTNSYADGDSNYDGVCEVCHTQTWFHRNDSSGDHDHFAGQDCVACHTHENEFLIDVGEAHDTHWRPDGKGPGLDCLDCHTSSFPDLTDGADLATTTICDECHSAGGSYDGLDDATIGARNNFQDGVYDSDDQLLPGLEQWCAGCHDEDPANSMIDGSGVDAPAVIGDETATTDYGAGYGFYMTGHGLPTTDSYPASLEPGAGLGCLDCHDASAVHIDHVARTYEPDAVYLTYDPVSAAYQDGYRLVSVSSGYDNTYPMHVPRTGHTFPPGFQEDWEFALCFECHDRDALLTGMTTYFRNDSTPRNLHEYHMSGPNGPWGPTTPQWDSDADGSADSRMSCPACHNVHGSPSPRMIRHGELIDYPNSLDYNYQPKPGTTLPASTGGEMNAHGTWGPGTVGSNGVCNMCHSNFPSYSRTP